MPNWYLQIDMSRIYALTSLVIKILLVEQKKTDRPAAFWHSNNRRWLANLDELQAWSKLLKYLYAPSKQASYWKGILLVLINSEDQKLWMMFSILVKDFCIYFPISNCCSSCHFPIDCTQAWKPRITWNCLVFFGFQKRPIFQPNFLKSGLRYE